MLYTFESIFDYNLEIGVIELIFFINKIELNLSLRIMFIIIILTLTIKKYF